MKKKPYGIVVVLALLMGFGGGMVLGQEEDGGNGDADSERAAPPSILDTRKLEKVVQANKFELVNDKGQVRAVLGLNSEGEPRLALADASGQIQVALSLETNQRASEEKYPMLRFYDKAGRVRNEIGLDRAGNPMIVLRHKEEKSYEDIAEILKLPLGTVKARIFRAREMLNKKMRDIL